MSRNFTLSTLLCLFIAMTSHLPAGVVFHLQAKDLEQSPPAVNEGTISIEGDRLRLEIDPESTMIFDGEQKRMIVTMESEKKYVVIDKQSIDQLAAKLNPMLEQLREQMENLPAEQRAMMEEMMNRQMDNAGKPIEIRETSEQRTIGSYPGTRYDVFQEGKKVREMWVTDWNNIAGADEARHVFEDMADFFREAFQSLTIPGLQMPENPFEELDKVNGFPVLTTELANGKAILETVFTSSEEKQLDDSVFQPPAGYKEQQMDVH